MKRGRAVVLFCGLLGPVLAVAVDQWSEVLWTVLGYRPGSEKSLDSSSFTLPIVNFVVFLYCVIIFLPLPK